MEAKAADVKACFGDGTNNTDSAVYTLTTSSKTNALPIGWYGQFIRIRPVGGAIWFYFSKNASATIAANPVPSDAGTQAATQGEYIPNGELFHCTVPYGDQPIYFVRIGDTASTAVYITKASGAPGRNAVE